MFLLRLYIFSSCSDMSLRGGCIIIFACTKLAAAARTGRMITDQWVATPWASRSFGLLATFPIQRKPSPWWRSLVAELMPR